MNRVENGRKTCYAYLQEVVEHPFFDIFFVTWQFDAMDAVCLLAFL